jgi:hypothetical protein
MNGIFGYLGGQNTNTDLPQFLKQNPDKVLSNKISTQVSSSHVSDSQLPTNNYSLWENMKFNTSMTSLNFKKQSEVYRTPTHSPTPKASTTSGLGLGFIGEIKTKEELKSVLIDDGHIFKNKGESEYLVGLIDDILVDQELGLQESVRITLRKVNGSYSVIVTDKNNPEMQLTMNLL